MSRFVAFPVCALFLAALFAADQTRQKPKPAKVEPMASDRFSEAHAPLFQPPKSNEAGTLTEQVSPSKHLKLRSAPVPRRTYVDAYIFGKMTDDGIPHAAISGDYEFLRRVSLDLTGRIPSTDEIRAFVADTDWRKRDKAIDRMLASEAFVDKWAYFFMDLFRANGKMGRGQDLFHYWMKENLNPL